MDLTNSIDRPISNVFIDHRESEFVNQENHGVMGIPNIQNSYPNDDDQDDCNEPIEALDLSMKQAESEGQFYAEKNYLDSSNYSSPPSPVPQQQTIHVPTPIMANVSRHLETSALNFQPPSLSGSNSTFGIDSFSTASSSVTTNMDLPDHYSRAHQQLVEHNTLVSDQRNELLLSDPRSKSLSSSHSMVSSASSSPPSTSLRFKQEPDQYKEQAQFVDNPPIQLPPRKKYMMEHFQSTSSDLSISDDSVFTTPKSQFVTLTQKSETNDVHPIWTSPTSSRSLQSTNCYRQQLNNHQIHFEKPRIHSLSHKSTLGIKKRIENEYLKNVISIRSQQFSLSNRKLSKGYPKSSFKATKHHGKYINTNYMPTSMKPESINTMTTSQSSDMWDRKIMSHKPCYPSTNRMNETLVSSKNTMNFNNSNEGLDRFNKPFNEMETITKPTNIWEPKIMSHDSGYSSTNRINDMLLSPKSEIKFGNSNDSGLDGFNKPLDEAETNNGFEYHHRMSSSTSSTFRERSPIIEDRRSSLDNPSSSSSSSVVASTKGRRGRPRKHAPKIPLPPLYVFLRNLLYNKFYNGKIIKWAEEEDGTFKICDTAELAKTWGLMKSKQSDMNYEKMSRAMRYHYGNVRQGRKGHLAMVKEKRLVYKFGELATRWRENEVIDIMMSCHSHELCQNSLCLWTKE